MCTSRMNSPEWLREGAAQPPNTPKMDTGRDANVRVDHETSVQGRATEQEHRERERERGKEREEANRTKKERGGKKTEEERQSENVSGLKIKCEQEKPCLLRDKTKRSGKPEQKQSTKRKTGALVGW